MHLWLLYHYRNSRFGYIIYLGTISLSIDMHSLRLIVMVRIL